MPGYLRAIDIVHGLGLSLHTYNFICSSTQETVEFINALNRKAATMATDIPYETHKPTALSAFLPRVQLYCKVWEEVQFDGDVDVHFTLRANDDKAIIHHVFTTKPEVRKLRAYAKYTHLMGMEEVAVRIMQEPGKEFDYSDSPLSTYSEKEYNAAMARLRNAVKARSAGQGYIKTSQRKNKITIVYYGPILGA